MVDGLRDVGDEGGDPFVKRCRGRGIRGGRLAGSKVDRIVDHFRRDGEAGRVRGYILRVNPGRCASRNSAVAHIFPSKDSHTYIEIQLDHHFSVPAAITYHAPNYSTPARSRCLLRIAVMLRLFGARHLILRVVLPDSASPSYPSDTAGSSLIQAAVQLQARQVEQQPLGSNLVVTKTASVLLFPILRHYHLAPDRIYHRQHPGARQRA
jgi:hypothetical protein